MSEHNNTINFQDIDIYSMTFNDLLKLKVDIEKIKDYKNIYTNSKKCYDKQEELINSLMDFNNRNNINSNELLSSYIDKLNIEKIKLTDLRTDYYNNCKNFFNLRNSITDIIQKLNFFVNIINDLDDTIDTNDNDNIYKSQFNPLFYQLLSNNIRSSSNAQPNDDFSYEHYQNIK
jgi:hypothetical protein